MAEDSVIEFEVETTQLTWVVNSSTDAPFLALQMTLNSSEWPGLVPGGRYRAALQAISSIGTSRWSAWSCTENWPLRGYCLGQPWQPNPPRRESIAFAREGQVRVVWEAIRSANETGGDDPLDGGVVYDLWGRPRPPSSGAWPPGQWHRVRQSATHAVRGGRTVPLQAAAIVDTWPDTPYGTPWAFKLRVGNRNGAFGPFSREVILYSGVLPGAPSTLRLSWSPVGLAELSWRPPRATGTPTLTRYEARCSDDGARWVSTESSLPHLRWERAMQPGPMRCEVRAVNAVGPGPAVDISFHVLR